VFGDHDPYTREGHSAGSCLEGHAGSAERYCRRCLGQSVAFIHFAPEFFGEGAVQFLRDRRGADGAPFQRRRVVLVPRRVAEEYLVHGRHADEVVGPVFFDKPEDLFRIEPAHEYAEGVGVRAKVPGVHGHHPEGVGKGQAQDRNGALGPFVGLPGGHRVRVEVVMGEHDSFGPPGGP